MYRLALDNLNLFWFIDQTKYDPIKLKIVMNALLNYV